MYQKNFKQKAIDLRKQGYSYNYIKDQLSVSKSTLSGWLSEIHFKPNQHTIGTIKKAHIASGQKKTKEKLVRIKKADTYAQNSVGDLSKRDLFMLGLGIYIGEGTKTGGMVRIINANPRIITLGIKWFIEICGMSKKNLKLRLHIYPDNNEKECVEYWSQETGLPRNQFQKTVVDQRSRKQVSKRGKLPFGTAHLSVVGFKNNDHEFGLHRMITAWINYVL